MMLYVTVAVMIISIILIMPEPNIGRITVTTAIKVREAIDWGMMVCKILMEIIFLTIRYGTTELRPTRTEAIATP